MESLAELSAKYNKARTNKELHAMYKSAHDLASYYERQGDHGSATLYHDHAFSHVVALLKMDPFNTDLLKNKCIQMFKMAKVNIQMKPNSLEALEYLKNARDIAKRHNFDEQHYEILNILFTYFRNQDNFEASLEVNAQALMLVDKMSQEMRNGNSDDLQRKKANIYLNGGIVYTKLGEYDKADEYLQQAKQLHLDTENFDDEAQAICAMGDLSFETGEYDEAHTHYERALRTFIKSKNWNDVIRVYGKIYNVMYCWGNDSDVDCRDYFKKAEKAMFDQNKVIQEHCASNKVYTEQNTANRKQIQSTLAENAKQNEKIHDLARESIVKKKVGLIREIIEMASKKPIENHRLRVSMARMAMEIVDKKEKLDWKNEISKLLLDIVINKGETDYMEELQVCLQEASSLCEKKGDLKAIQDASANIETFQAWRKKSSGVLQNPTLDLNASQDDVVEIIEDKSEILRVTMKTDFAQFSKRMNESIANMSSNSLDQGFLNMLKKKYDEILESFLVEAPSKKVKM